MSGLALAALLALGMTGELCLLWFAVRMIADPSSPPAPMRPWLGLDPEGPPVEGAVLQAHARLGLLLGGLAVLGGLALGVGFGLLRVLPRG